MLTKALVHLVLDLPNPWVIPPALRQGQHLLEELCEGSTVQPLLLWTQLARLSYALADRSLGSTLLDPMTERSLCSLTHQIGGVTGVNFPKLGTAQSLLFGSLCLLSSSF